MKNINTRLEYLRQELRAERISYGELAELQSLAAYIAPNDVELLEAAGVPEFEETETTSKVFTVQNAIGVVSYWENNREESEIMVGFKDFDKIEVSITDEYIGSIEDAFEEVINVAFIAHII